MHKALFLSKVALGLLLLTFCVLLCSDAKKTGSIRKCGGQPGCRKGKVCVKTGSTFSCRRKVIRPVQHEGEPGGAADAGGSPPECPVSNRKGYNGIISYLGQDHVKQTLAKAVTTEALSNYPALADDSMASTETFVSQFGEYLATVTLTDKFDAVKEGLISCKNSGTGIKCQLVARVTFLECLNQQYRNI